ncbi:DUF3592 domain-containing protein [Roseivirga sp. BDSF3-8]|uniref:DUF3592 domain-containing protein n=1 Tax=Roseivirga sp. BDSF3-8 TaxID=3241598 RepID=UPI0035325FB4
MEEIIICGLIGLAFTALGLQLWQKSSHLRRNGEAATAIIFRNEAKYSIRKEIRYYPVIRFKTAEADEWITKQLSVGYNSPKPEGSNVSVKYDRDNPGEVMIDSPLTMTYLPLLLMSIGGIGLMAALFLAISPGL